MLLGVYLKNVFYRYLATLGPKRLDVILAMHSANCGVEAVCSRKPSAHKKYHYGKFLSMLLISADVAESKQDKLAMFNLFCKKLVGHVCVNPVNDKPFPFLGCDVIA